MRIHLHGFRWFALACAILLTSAAAQTVPPLIGFHTNHITSFPIQVPYDCWRSLNSTGSGGGSSWGDINTAKGVYNYSLIDREMQGLAAQNKTCVMYTPIGTPTFVALDHGWSRDGTKSRVCTCGKAIGATGCNPPSDMNADGSGTNQTWKDFITALATHVHQSHTQNPTTYADIEYWENGNEVADNGPQFCGSFPQLARMMMDEKAIVNSINPAAKLLTVALFHTDAGLQYLLTVSNVANGKSPAELADIINTHPYVGSRIPPEGVINELAGFRRMVDSVPAAKGKPIFGTEGGFFSPKPPDTWAHANTFLERYLISLSSTGLIGFNFFGYDFYQTNTQKGPGITALWAKDNTSFCTIAANPGFFCPPELGYSRVYNWLQKISFKSVCSGVAAGAGKIWTCDHTSSGDFYSVGSFAWFDVQDSTAKYMVPSGFSEMQDIGGKMTNIAAGQSITLSNDPVLLMNGLPAPTNLTVTTQ